MDKSSWIGTAIGLIGGIVMWQTPKKHKWVAWAVLIISAGFIGYGLGKPSDEKSEKHPSVTTFSSPNANSTNISAESIKGNIASAPGAMAIGNQNNYTLPAQENKEDLLVEAIFRDWRQYKDVEVNVKNKGNIAIVLDKAKLYSENEGIFATDMDMHTVIDMGEEKSQFGGTYRKQKKEPYRLEPGDKAGNVANFVDENGRKLNWNFWRKDLLVEVETTRGNSFKARVKSAD